MRIALSPTQETAVAEIERLLPHGNVFVLWARTGFGGTTMARELRRRIGGKLLDIRAFIEAQEDVHPFHLDDALYRILKDALEKDDIVLFDNLCGPDYVFGYCRTDYPRAGMYNPILGALCGQAIEAGRKLILVSDGKAPGPVHQRCFYSGFPEFQIEDYQHLCRAFLRERAAALDMPRLHRYAPHLSAHQIRNTCRSLEIADRVSTEAFMDHLLENGLVSNVSLGEVEYVDLRDLKGIDNILQSLDTNVIVPFEQNDLVVEIGLKPKKGVLLFGPPGTGKTSIGRALAHRLKGKFFLIDGNFIAGSDNFMSQVRQVFQAARENAPSIVFIDDSDVLWENEDDTGFYRYLLTELDGLENSQQGMVCVVMTAMDIGELPPALIRSGRVELWLEMPMPDETAREAIIRHWLAELPECLRDVDMSRLVSITDDFTGADLRRLVDDGKNLYAYDRVRAGSTSAPTVYFERAVEHVRENQRKQRDAAERNRGGSLGGSWLLESEEDTRLPTSPD